MDGTQDNPNIWFIGIWICFILFFEVYMDYMDILEEFNHTETRSCPGVAW